MTNEEKFIEVFGFSPDTESLIKDCPQQSMETCPYYEDLYGCHCELWWYEEYAGRIQDKLK